MRQVITFFFEGGAKNRFSSHLLYTCLVMTSSVKIPHDSIAYENLTYMSEKWSKNCNESEIWSNHSRMIKINSFGYWYTSSHNFYLDDDWMNIGVIPFIEIIRQNLQNTCNIFAKWTFFGDTSCSMIDMLYSCLENVIRLKWILEALINDKKKEI